MEIKLFLPDQVEAVFEFEKNRLEGGMSELQIEMQSWDQPWRKESLQHYSQLGWSFVQLDADDKIQGYILGQPFLFFNNWTQTLWVEHVAFDNPEVGLQLVDTIVRWAKTKHLQKVLMNCDSSQSSFVKESFPGFNEKGYFHLSTTKLSEESQ